MRKFILGIAFAALSVSACAKSIDDLPLPSEGDARAATNFLKQLTADDEKDSTLAPDAGGFMAGERVARYRAWQFLKSQEQRIPGCDWAPKWPEAKTYGGAMKELEAMSQNADIGLRNNNLSIEDQRLKTEQVAFKHGCEDGFVSWFEGMVDVRNGEPKRYERNPSSEATLKDTRSVGSWTDGETSETHQEFEARGNRVAVRTAKEDACRGPYSAAYAAFEAAPSSETGNAVVAAHERLQQCFKAADAGQ